MVKSFHSFSVAALRLDGNEFLGAAQPRAFARGLASNCLWQRGSEQRDFPGLDHRPAALLAAHTSFARRVVALAQLRCADKSEGRATDSPTAVAGASPASRGNSGGAAGVKRTRRRTCVGCGSDETAEELIRFVLKPGAVSQTATEGPSAAAAPCGVVVDLAGKSFGRGVWVHARVRCLKSAAQRGFSKSFRTDVRIALDEVLGLLREAAERRLEGLLRAALRAGHSEFGADAVRACAGDARLVLIAEGAGNVAQQNWLLELGRRGRVVVAGNKQLLGAVCGRREVAVLALTDPRIARAVALCVGLTRLRVDGAESRPVSEV